MSIHSDLQTTIDEINRLITSNPGQLPKYVYGIDLGNNLTFVLDGNQDTLSTTPLPKGGLDCLITTDPVSLITLLTSPSQAGLLVWTRKIQVTDPMMAVTLALKLQSLRSQYRA